MDLIKRNSSSLAVYSVEQNTSSLTLLTYEMKHPSVMDKKLTDLHHEGQLEELKQRMVGKESEVLKLLDQRLLRGTGDPTLLLRTILAGWPSDDDNCVKHRVALYRHSITLLQKRELSTKLASDLAATLVLHVDDMPAHGLVELCSLFLDSVKSGNLSSSRSLEVLARVLSTLPLRNTVNTGSVGEMTGAQYKSHVLNSLCSSKWDNTCVITLASMFRDVTMTTEEHRLVMTKLLRMMGCLPLQELPPLVYQLLLLASKGLKRQTLEGIGQFFTQQDQDYRKQMQRQEIDDDLCESPAVSENLHHVEGTVILHITMATRQDQELARELIKMIKAGSQGRSVLTSFTIALSLSISRIHRFHDQVFELLKSCIIKSYHDNEHRCESGWVREMVTEDEDVGCYVLDTVNNSVVGWDHVTQGMVELGFVLMEAFSPRTRSASHLTTPAYKAAMLGKDVLLQSFKIHKMVREEILDQTLNHIITKATNPVNHYLELLASVVRSHPQIVIDLLPRIRESLDYLALLPLASAEGLLRALQPLLRISMSLRDNVILTLRKSLFSRQVESRQVAVTGFLLLLRQLRVVGGVSCSQASQASFSCSQVAVDIHMAGSSSGGGWSGLCLEVLGNLRRCLTQQAHVRLLLYQGLYEVACRNTSLIAPILSLLLHHFEQYYETSQDIVPPVNLAPCLVAEDNTMVTTEPLAHLLQCVVACLSQNARRKDDLTDEEEEVCERWRSTLASLSQRMLISQLDDFELDKSGDFSANTSVGSKNSIKAILLSGICDTLMEYKLDLPDYEKASVGEGVDLFKQQQVYSGLVKEKGSGGGGGGKRGRPTAGSSSDTSSKGYKSLVSLRCVSETAHALFVDELPVHQEGLNELRSRVDLQLYIISVANQKLAQIKQTGECDGPDGGTTERVVKHVINIARAVMRRCVESGAAGEKRERVKTLTIACLDVYAAVVNIFTSHYSPKLIQLLSALEGAMSDGGAVSETDLQILLQQHINRCQRLVMDVVTDEDRSPREAVYLLTALGDLMRQVTPGEEAHTQVTAWAHKLCTDHNIDDTGLVKCALGLLLDVTGQTRSNVTILRDLARDVHSKMGDIDQEVDVEEESAFSVVSIHTAVPTVLLLVLRHADRQLQHTDWVISTIQYTKQQQVEEALTQKEDCEKAVCTRLGHLVNMYHELVQTALPAGPATEALLRSLIHLFTSLTALTKYYIGLYQTGSGHLSSRYEKLMKLCGSNLSPYVYALVNYVQAKQSESLQNLVDKSKKKKGDVKRADSNKDKTRVLRETKSIPGLIFAMELLERFLIQLSKKSKVSLMQYFKMSTSRDFRINAASLEQALEEQNEDSEAEGESGSDDEADKGPDADASSSDNDQENQEPPSKRNKSSINISPVEPPRIKPTFRRLSKNTAS